MSTAAAPSFLADRPFPYCRGCGHGLVARRLNEALGKLQLDPSEIVLTTDIGCVGLVDPLFPGVHTVHTIHGRSTAVAAGAVLADAVAGDGRMKNIVMIGDGGATIGLQHLTQAALLNVDLTVLLHNNMLYGMTGGQHSALTPEGFHTSTTLHGNWVPSIDMEHLLQGCQGAFYARHLATDGELGDVIAEAIAFSGFALVEILELCTGFAVPMNKMDGKALRALAEADGRALGIRLRRTDRRPYHAVYRERFPGQPAAPAPSNARPGAGPTSGVGDVPDGAGSASAPVDISSGAGAAGQGTREPGDRRFAHRVERPTTIVVAGSAGEKVQTAAAVLSQAAVLSGLHCVQKNDYPVTVGSGFSLSEVKLAPEPILYTGADAPDAVLIASPDGLREVKTRGDFLRLAAGATVIADDGVAGDLPPERTLVLPLRKTLSADTAALGAVAALVARTGILEPAALVAAIRMLAGKDAAALERALTTGATLGR